MAPVLDVLDLARWNHRRVIVKMKITGKSMSGMARGKA